MRPKPTALPSDALGRMVRDHDESTDGRAVGLGIQ